MSGCCDHKDLSPETGIACKRALWTVIILNAGMFAAEIVLGLAAGSVALWADSLDFAADAATYAISLWALGQAALVKARVAAGKAWSLVVMGVVVMVLAAWRAIFGDMPQPGTMSVTAMAAFVVNLLSVFLLLGFRDGDANIRSVWLCSRNDMIGNALVLAAAAGVFGWQSKWPDLLVAAVMASLFVSSAWSILQQARSEQRQHSAAAE